MGRLRIRSLKVGEDAYRWSAGHVHGPDGADCREVVRIARTGHRGRGLQVTFRPGRGLLVNDGYPMHDGLVWRAADDAPLNLHLPSVVRAVLDAAVERGWDTRSDLDLDGWELLDAVVARLPSAP
ncbi:hypothetical protein DZF91_15470 [Actinomadura logoneensis]|uniref:Uncharacterized protein n=1 Tax=Actinomadura logoneensis TaxID=2293572 RepID=A0A372JL67_9ACTN|nr:hypothetical protein [Actinomadura logoneensis]RFU40772.1 hypothetical protein DZF91_15470 [Actinomadura logoneensis]